MPSLLRVLLGRLLLLLVILVVAFTTAYLLLLLLPLAILQHRLVNPPELDVPCPALLVAEIKWLGFTI